MILKGVLNMTFYETLSKLMKERNVTSKELSETLKFGKNQIKYWKDNGNIPNGETLISLSNYFDVSIDYLLGRTNEPNGVYQNSNSGNIVNGNNGDNSPLTVNGKVPPDDTDELVDLVKGLPLVKRAEAVLYLNDLKNKK